MQIHKVVGPIVFLILLADQFRKVLIPKRDIGREEKKIRVAKLCIVYCIHASGSWENALPSKSLEKKKTFLVRQYLYNSRFGMVLSEKY